MVIVRSFNLGIKINIRATHMEYFDENINLSQRLQQFISHASMSLKTRQEQFVRLGHALFNIFWLVESLLTSPTEAV